ncbi:protein Peter pan-like [Lutzomyia longipalpis]|uniref:protein Peter pan-like n=1 Tax=Lutzomyia longipalpis TaxID=7200 RepID=UPI0024845548|nr:protein Peter pan-like [Lutzomyia longipalpis]
MGPAVSQPISDYIETRFGSLFLKSPVFLRHNKASRGPTLTFKIHPYGCNFSPKEAKHDDDDDYKAYESAPLVVLNSFSGQGKHLKLMAQMLQNMFLTINVSMKKMLNISKRKLEWNQIEIFFPP